MPFSLPRTPLGRRRVRLRFEKRQTSDDGLGGEVVSWVTSGNAWGRITALDERGREQLNGLQLQGRAAYHVDVAYRRDLDPIIPAQWRLVWERKTLEIQSAVDDTGRKRRLVMLATETE